MPKRTLITLTAALAMSLAATAPTSAQGPDQQEIGLLFAQTATRGSLDQLEGESRFALTLHGVAKQTVWFSDRPARQAGHIPTPGFVRAWEGFGFAEDPPNAALTVLDAADGQDTVALTLGRPRYDGKTRTVRYPAVMLDTAAGNLSHFEPQRDLRVPRRFEDASLFIDDATAPVVGVPPCVIQPFTECPRAYLRWADLRGAKLWGANLREADLQVANLIRAELNGAKLSSANLSYAGLSFADLSYADLREADLQVADLSGANLRNASLSRADLREADLTGADLTRATVTDLIVTGAIFCRTTLPDGFISNRDC